MNNCHILVKVQAIKQVFGLNNNQISKITDTPIRFTYMSDRYTCSSPKLNKLYNNALLVSKMIDADIRPLLKSVKINEKTLLSHLQDIDIDVYFLVWICKQLDQYIKSTNIGTISTTQQSKTVRMYTTLG